MAKAGTILRFAGQNYINGLPEAHRDAATRQLQAVLDTAVRFNTEVDEVSNNSEFSNEGRASARARVAASALATLTAIEDTTIRTLAERASSLEQALLAKVTYSPPKDPAERIAQEMHLQEIRSQLRGLSMSERTNLYRTTSDPMIIAAIDTATVTLSAPRADGSQRLEPFIDPAERTAAALARAERSDPVAAATLGEVRSLRECYAQAVASVKSEIVKEVGVVLPVGA